MGWWTISRLFLRGGDFLIVFYGVDDFMIADTLCAHYRIDSLLTVCRPLHTYANFITSTMGTYPSAILLGNAHGLRTSFLSEYFMLSF